MPKAVSSQKLLYGFLKLYLRSFEVGEDEPVSSGGHGTTFHAEAGNRVPRKSFTSPTCGSFRDLCHF